ncbi:MAG: prepilin-type N-terminal cleavage/methylation domain-containing protein [Verrucomicrobiota bacterium]
MRQKNLTAFTLIEMLVVIAIIATIAAFAVPALTSALTKGQMTGTMNNARQLYLAGYQMALDGAANGDANLAWPGDYTAGTVTTLKDYVEKLVQNDYLKASDLAKMLSAPGASCTAIGTTAGGGIVAVTLTGNSGLKVYPVKDNDSSNVIFSTTSNFVYGTALNNTSSPYGDKGFVVVRKGGDGSVLRKNNAVAIAGQEPTFESNVGKKPGEPQGTVTPGDPLGVLKQP